MEPNARERSEGRDEVDLEHAAEGGGVGGLGRSDEADARVVDEDVGAAPAFGDEGNGLRDQSLVSDVADELLCFRTSRAQSGERSFAGLHIEQQERITSLAEHLGCSAADALGRSCHDGNSHIFTLFQRCGWHICDSTLK